MCTLEELELMKGNFLQDFRKKRQLEIGLKLDNQLTCWMLILFLKNMLHQSMFKISTDTDDSAHSYPKSQKYLSVDEMRIISRVHLVDFKWLTTSFRSGNDKGSKWSKATEGGIRWFFCISFYKVNLCTTDDTKYLGENSFSVLNGNPSTWMPFGEWGKCFERLCWCGHKLPFSMQPITP